MRSRLTTTSAMTMTCVHQEWDHVGASFQEGVANDFEVAASVIVTGQRLNLNIRAYGCRRKPPALFKRWSRCDHLLRPSLSAVIFCLTSLNCILTAAVLSP